MARAAGVIAIFARNRFSLAGVFILAAITSVAVTGIWLSPFDPMRSGVGEVMLPPGAAYLMGTDELGRDIFSRVLAATRTSLGVGICAAATSTAIAVVVGALAGFIGGWIDDILMRITEIFQVIPRFFLTVLMVALFGASLMNVVLAIAVLSWPEVARVVRAEVLSLRSRQFVFAAQVAGAGPVTLIMEEILPNALGPIIVNATLQVGQAILLEAGLSYLGLGDPSTVSLGLMIYQAQEIMRTAWWATAFPGAFIFLTVVSINLVGDGLNDVFNPRSRNR